MKSLLWAVVAASILATTACGPAESQPESAAPTTTAASESPTPTPTPTAFTISEEATCMQLIGPDEDGPLIDYVNGITTVDPTDATAVQELSATREEVREIAKRANPEMGALLDALFSEDVNDFKAAGTELLTRCS